MSITIGSNIASMMAQRQLGAASNAYAQSLQRLSSGQRINTASDDAAGLAISESLNTDGRVFSQAIRNLNDGLSLLAIADGAVEQLASIVTRQRELATQAANGSYGTKQRQALNTEAQALSQEYFRIAHTTSFNGMKLFDGSLGQVVLQGGYGTLGSVASSLGGKMGDGTFARTTTLAAVTGDAPQEVVAADVNNDGILDLMTSNAAPGAAAINVYLGNGDGSFQAARRYGSGVNARTLAAKDLNGDDIVDVVVADTFTDQVIVLLGNGDGSFQSQRTYVTGDSPFRPVISDLNNDGISDIVVANNNGGTTAAISLLLGNGDGTFRAQTCLSAVAGYHIEVNTGDLNGDGNVDLVFSTESQGLALTYLGNGNGTFRAPSSWGMGTNAWGTIISDLNGDGLADLATVLRGDNRIVVRLGNGDGTFRVRQSYSVGTNPNALNYADLNGDGKLDIVALNASDVSVLLGNGDGSFLAQISIVGANDSLGRVPLRDLNGDGILDLAVVNDTTHQVSLLLGNQREGIGQQPQFSLGTRSDALLAMRQFSSNLDVLSAQRATIGAFQSRLTSSIATLLTTRENYAAAESRIRDTDVVVESSQALRLNIVQQAAQAILAQANQQPQIALQLLRF